MSTKRKRNANSNMDTTTGSNGNGADIIPVDAATSSESSSNVNLKQARRSAKNTSVKARQDDSGEDDIIDHIIEEAIAAVEDEDALKKSLPSSSLSSKDHKGKQTKRTSKDSARTGEESTGNGHASKDIVIASPTPEYSYPINPPPVGRPVRIYCDGIYDLFHFGHAKALEQAKKAFPEVYLIVGVCDDKMTHNRKGKTVMIDKERYESVRHCKWVDEVVESAPWVVDQAFLDAHKIDYVAHDDIPYKSIEGDDVYAFVKRQGMFWPTQRTDGVSTSDLITRIVKDYDQYLRRNLERGVPAKELGIGFFKEQEVKLKKSASDIRASIRQNWHGTKDELKNEISVLRNDLRQTMAMWEDKSQEFVRDFSKLFGADSVVNKIFNRRNRHGTRMIKNGAEGDDGTLSNMSSRPTSPFSDSELENGSDLDMEERLARSQRYAQLESRESSVGVEKSPSAASATSP